MYGPGLPDARTAPSANRVASAKAVPTPVSPIVPVGAPKTPNPDTTDWTDKASRTVWRRTVSRVVSSMAGRVVIRLLRRPSELETTEPMTKLDRLQLP